jgi:processive 1,2-diacylglycerol beta-glucosyltransferase
MRVLVLSASVGAGHLRAAEAVELALRQLHPEATVRNLDVLTLTNAAFRRVYGRAYLDLVNRAPHVLGYFYDLMDRPTRTGRHRTDNLRLAVQKMNLTRFIRFLREGDWDLVINTHFLPAEIIASLRKKRRLDIPQVTVTTDFETHRLWVNQPCERYFTATEEGSLYLHSWGIPVADTVATGIPIHPAFSEPKSRLDLLARHELLPDRTVILQLAGGFGVGPIEKLYSALLDIEPAIQLLVVTGRNENARKKLATIACPARHRVKIIGFTQEIDELMAVADLVVSKPGGLTTSEALARELPMALVEPIPGQEERNADHLLEAGAAVRCNNLPAAAWKIAALVDQPEKLRAMKQAARSMAHPDAARRIAQDTLGLLH